MPTKTKTVTLPEEVIAQDAAYEAAISGGKHAEVKRDRLRWEWTRCPLGPGLSLTDYAEQVGRAVSTVHASVEAHASVIPSDAEESTVCLYGERHLIDAPEHEEEEPTDEEVAEHYKAKIAVTRSAAYSIISGRLAALSRNSIKTITGNATWTPLTQEAMRRFEVEVDPSAPDAEDQIEAIAEEVYDDHKQRENRVRKVKAWMAKNRGVPASQVTLNDARKMMVRIEDTMARKDLTYALAEAERREWDHKRCEADRITNELRRKARQAIRDLMEASAEVRGAAEKVVKSRRKIEDEGIEMGQEEQDLCVADLHVAEAAVRLALAAITGASGTDWDAELERLGGLV